MEYVLTDKTGTLTQNKMVLRGIFIGDELFGGRFSQQDKDTTFKKFNGPKFDKKLDLYVFAGKKAKLDSYVPVAKYRIPV